VTEIATMYYVHKEYHVYRRLLELLYTLTLPSRI